MALDDEVVIRITWKIPNAFMCDKKPCHDWTARTSLPAWIIDLVRHRKTSAVRSHLSSMKDTPHGDHSIRLTIGRDRRKTNIYLVEYDTEPDLGDVASVNALGLDDGEAF